MDNYSFDKVIAIFGAVPLSGFAEGDDAITIRRRTAHFDLTVGVDGRGIASRSADLSGEIVLKLLQTSPTNLYLGALVQAQEFGATFTPLPFLLKDASNQLQLVAAKACIVMAPAEQVYGGTQNAREWTLLAEAIEMI